MGCTDNEGRDVPAAASIEDMVDGQPYGEPFTYAWRLEHARSADATLAGVDLIIEQLADMADDEHPDPRDIELTALMIARAQAGYVAANVMGANGNRLG